MPLCWCVPQETDAEKVAPLERENQSLRREVERLRRLLEEALRAPSVEQHRSLAQARKLIRPLWGVKPETGMVAFVGSRFRSLSMRFWMCPCRGAVRIAAAGVKETGVVSQYQTEIPEPRVRGLSFGFIWTIAGVVGGRCKAGIRDRPRRRWAVRPRSWGRGR